MLINGRNKHQKKQPNVLEFQKAHFFKLDKFFVF